MKFLAFTVVSSLLTLFPVAAQAQSSDIVINSSKSNGISRSYLFEITDAAPGNSYIYEVTMVNELSQKVDVYLEHIDKEDNNELSQAVQIQLPDFDVLFDGSDPSTPYQYYLFSIDQYQSSVLTLRVSLPVETPNQAQSQKASYHFVFRFISEDGSVPNTGIAENNRWKVWVLLGGSLVGVNIFFEKRRKHETQI